MPITVWMPQVSLLVSPNKEVKSRDRPGQSARTCRGLELQHWKGSPSSPQLSRCLALRSCCAPRRLLTCRSADRPASSRGSGTGHGPASDSVPASRPAAMKLPGELPAPGPRPCRCRRLASAPWTAPARPPPPRAPYTVPGAPHPGSAALSSQPGPRRLRADLGERRGGSPPPAATACLSPPCSLPRSRISPPGTPDPAPGRGGAGREVGEPGGGGGARGAQLEPAFLLPGARPSSPAFLPYLLSRIPEAMRAALGLLGAFLSSEAPKL